VYTVKQIKLTVTITLIIFTINSTHILEMLMISDFTDLYTDTMKLDMWVNLYLSLLLRTERLRIH